MWPTKYAMAVPKNLGVGVTKQLLVCGLTICLKRCADEFSSDEIFLSRIFHQQMAIFCISSFARVEKELG